MQNPLWIDKRQRETETDNEINERQNGTGHCMTQAYRHHENTANLPQKQTGGKTPSSLWPWRHEVFGSDETKEILSSFPESLSMLHYSSWEAAFNYVERDLFQLTFVCNWDFQAHAARIGTLPIIWRSKNLTVMCLGLINWTTIFNENMWHFNYSLEKSLICLLMLYMNPYKSIFFFFSKGSPQLTQLCYRFAAVLFPLWKHGVTPSFSRHLSLCLPCSA